MSENENTQASQPDAYQEQHQTQNFPAYEPPPPGAYPGQPRWASAPAANRPRLREAAVLGVSLGASLALVIGLLAAVVTWTPVGDWAGLTQANSAGATAQAAAGDQPAAPAFDLREGAVFVQSNDARNNEVVAFARGQDGKLREVGRYSTGGTGSGTAEDNSNGLVLGTAEGETSPVHNIDKGDLLFVPNAGNNTISVMKVKADGLELVSKVSSGGEKPVSVTVNHGLLYVLNSGEYDDRLIIGPNEALENCGHGQLPSVTGFRVDPEGHLTMIDGSSRLLTGESKSGCAMVSFTPDGKTLLVTERIAGEATGEGGWPKGAIVSFPVRPDGTLGAKNVNLTTGNGPYGLTFKRDGTLITVEQNGAFLNFGGGQVATYKIGEDSKLTGVGPAVSVGGTDPCWFALTHDEQLLYVTSPFGGGSIASFSVSKEGQLTRLHKAASAVDGEDINNDHLGDGILDVGLSQDSKYLYQLNGLDGSLFVFQVNASNGTLTFIEKHQVFNLEPFGMGGNGGPFGIAVS